MSGMFIAIFAEFLELHTVWMVTLVLVGSIVPLLAVRAS